VNPNPKIILGAIFAVSFALFIGSTHNVYAAPLQCNPNSTLIPDTGNGLPGCVCDNGFQQNGFAGGQPLCIKIDVPVGGLGIPIDTTALLLAGMQGSALWMIPAIVIAGTGIGIFSFRKSKKKED
jgi:hypothetical protein